MYLDKLPGLEENVIIELIYNMPQLARLETDIYIQANSMMLSFSEFTTYIQHRVASYLSDHIRDQIDWEYIAAYWWERREVGNIPEDELNYNRNI